MAAAAKGAAGGGNSEGGLIDGLMYRSNRKSSWHHLQHLRREPNWGFDQKRRWEYALTGIAESIASCVSRERDCLYRLQGDHDAPFKMLVSCKPRELETASKIPRKACFKIGSTLHQGGSTSGIKEGLRQQEPQDCCCYSSMPQVVMQRSPLSARTLQTVAGSPSHQLQQLDWCVSTSPEWIARATLAGALPDRQGRSTLEALGLATAMCRSRWGGPRQHPREAEQPPRRGQVDTGLPRTLQDKSNWSDSGRSYLRDRRFWQTTIKMP